jgi:hypothetical protein
MVPDGADPAPIIQRRDSTRIGLDVAAMVRGIERARAMARLKALARSRPPAEELLILPEGSSPGPAHGPASDSPR